MRIKNITKNPCESCGGTRAVNIDELADSVECKCGQMVCLDCGEDWPSREKTLQQTGSKVKKIIAAVLAVFALGGCASTSATTDTTAVEAPQYDPTPAYEEPSSPFTEVEQEYLYDVHLVGNDIIDGNEDADLVDLGHTMCDTLDGGNTVSEITSYLVGTGDYDTDEKQQYAAGILAGSIMNLCPEYQYQVAE